MQNYTVWVGGIEINDHYLNLSDAKELAEKYRLQGYSDVVIEFVQSEGQDKARYTLQSQVYEIAENLNNSIMSGYDYLNDALDIQYIVDGEGNYIAARILVAFGGPNIWINTQTKTVEGYWWGDSAFASYYDDAMNIDEACNEFWDCK